MLWHLISSGCPLTVHASVSILAAPQTNGLLLKAEVEVSPEPPASLSFSSSRYGQRCRFSVHLLQPPITHVIRSGCHGNRQCSLSIQVGLFCAWTTPSVLCTVFVLPKPDERLHYFNCVFFQSFGRETLNEASRYSYKGDQQAVLTGCSM